MPVPHFYWLPQDPATFWSMANAILAAIGVIVATIGVVVAYRAFIRPWRAAQKAAREAPARSVWATVTLEGTQEVLHVGNSGQVPVFDVRAEAEIGSDILVIDQAVLPPGVTKTVEVTPGSPPSVNLRGRATPGVQRMIVNAVPPRPFKLTWTLRDPWGRWWKWEMDQKLTADRRNGSGTVALKELEGPPGPGTIDASAPHRD